MRVIKVDRHEVVVGLTWASLDKVPTRRDVKKAVAAAGSAVNGGLFITVGREGNFALGVGNAVRAKSGAVSLAAAVAGQGDGIYVADIAGDGTLWFAATANGCVIPDTDVVGAEAEIVELVGQYHAVMGSLPVHATSDVVLPGIEAVDFSFAEAVRGAGKRARMRATSAAGKAIVYVVAAAAVVLVALAIRTSTEKASAAAAAATAQQQIATTYLTSAGASVAAMPNDPAWVFAAWDAQTNLPSFFDGWKIDKVTCKPINCTATYGKAGTIFGVAGFITAFGSGAVTVKPDGSELSVSIPLNTRMATVTQGELRAPPKASTSIVDWVGHIPLHISGAQADPKATSTNLASGPASGAGFPPFYVETVTVKGVGTFNQQTLTGIEGYGDSASFRVTSLEWQRLPLSATWTVTLSRIRG